MLILIAEESEGFVLILMAEESEKVFKNLSWRQMPYFVIVRREIAQIKFITETKCVLYFGYCERKPMNGFSEKKSLKGLFTQPSFSQPIFGEIIQTKKFYQFYQNVSV